MCVRSACTDEPLVMSLIDGSAVFPIGQEMSWESLVVISQTHRPEKDGRGLASAPALFLARLRLFTEAERYASEGSMLIELPVPSGSHTDEDVFGDEHVRSDGPCHGSVCFTDSHGDGVAFSGDG